MIVRIESRGCECELRTAQSLFENDLVSLFKALATLRAFAESFIDSLGISAAALGGAAEFTFPNGIANADVHDAPELMRMDRSSKPYLRMGINFQYVRQRHNHSSGP
jgi:hypothetical protein